MNYEKIINLLRNEKWWIVEGPCVLSTVYPPIKGFIEMNRYLKGYSIGIFPCKKRYTLQLLMEKESIEIADFLYKKHLKDRGYFQKRIILWKAYSKALTDYCQKIEKSALSKISNNSLIRMYLKLNELYIKEFSIPLCAEGTGIYVDAKVAPEFSKYFNINLSMAHDYILILSSPIGRSFIEEERIGFLKLCIAYYDKEKDFTKMLNEHSRKYFWIRNNYERTEIISPNDFMNRNNNYFFPFIFLLSKTFLVLTISFTNSFSLGRFSLYSDASTLFGRPSRAYFATALSFSAQSIKPTGGFSSLFVQFSFA